MDSNKEYIVTTLQDKEQFDAFIAKSTPSLVHFSASWGVLSFDINGIISLFVTQNPTDTLTAASLDVEVYSEPVDKYNIKHIPTILVFKNGKVIERLEDPNAIELQECLTKMHYDSNGAAITDVLPSVEAPKTITKEEVKEMLENRLRQLIRQSRLTLFMKGSASQPRCGFSRQIIQLLDDVRADYTTFDILEDEMVRQGLKTYSDWPTYPQLYLDGEFIGGLDVVREELADPAFVEKLPKLP